MEKDKLELVKTPEEKGEKDSSSVIAASYEAKLKGIKAPRAIA